MITSRINLEQLGESLSREGSDSSAILLRVYHQQEDHFHITQTRILCPSDIDRQNKSRNAYHEVSDWEMALTEIMTGFINSGKSIWSVGFSRGTESAKDHVILEWIRSKIRLFIFGAGHIGQCVASLGAGIGYQVTVIDDRRDFASRLRFPDKRVELMVGDFNLIIPTLSVNCHSAIVIVTRGHQYDEDCLRSAIQTNAKYIGMIGSKKRVQAIFDKLVETGVKPEHLAKVKAPIGLQIGAKTPQEIGIAITAEIIACLNGTETAALAMSGK